MLYMLAKYFHLIGVVGLASAFSFEFAFSKRIQFAPPQGLSRAVEQFQRLKWIGIPSYFGVLISGIYMASQVGSESTFWIPISLASLILMMLIGGLMTGRMFAKGQRLLKEGGAPRDVKRTFNGFSVQASWWIRVFLVLGTMAVMTLKLSLFEGVLVEVIAIGAGLGIALSQRRRDPTEEHVEA